MERYLRSHGGAQLLAMKLIVIRIINKLKDSSQVTSKRLETMNQCVPVISIITAVKSYNIS